MKTCLYPLGVLLTLVSGALFAQTGSGYRITTVAGGYLGDDGPATAAVLSNFDKAITDSAGIIYIADTGNHRIRRVSLSGVITTLAGTGVAGYSGDGQPATTAQLNNPSGLALDGQGNLHVADAGNSRIRRVDAAGVITTIAGGTTATRLSTPRGIVFDASGNLYIVDSGSGRLMRLTPKGELQAVLGGFYGPTGVALDASGNILVADTYHHRVVKATPGGDYTIFAGSGISGFSADGETATAAKFSSPSDVTVDRTGAVYIADSGNNCIRRVALVGSDYVVSTVAGRGALTVPGGEYTGVPLGAPLWGPRGVWVDAGGALFISDSGFGMVRKLEGGILRTVAGASRSRGDGGPAVSASLIGPRNVVVDTTGNLLIADTGNHKIRKVSQDGVIQTLAGSGVAGGTGDGGRAQSAQLSSPVGVAADSTGNIYIGDTGNARLRRVSLSGDITTVSGGNGWGGEGDGAGATSAQVRDINGIAVDTDGNIYLADTGNNRIRRILKDGTIDRFAGTSYSGAGADGIAIQSSINSPQRVAVAKDGSIYFSDTGNHRVRRVLPNGNVETVAGNGTAGFSGDGGAAPNARLYNPTGVAVDSGGNLFIADTNNHRIRHVTPGGLIRTIAGTGTASYSGDDGSAFTAQLSSPAGIAVDSRGNIYIADQGNNRIRRLSADVSAGRLSIVSGNNQSGSTGVKLPVPLTVRLTNTTGAPVSGVSVSFVVTRGPAQLSASSVVTNADGVASVTVTLGGIPGDVFVVASAPGLLPIQFQLTIQGAIVTGQPRIFSGGVVGAGLSVPKVRYLAPNGLYTIFGENFAQPGAGWQVGPGDLVGGQVLPVRFQGVCVEVGGTPAPLIHVYPGQISFQAVGVNATGDVVPVQVILNCREEGEVRSNIENVGIRVASPEFLFFVQNADGRNPAAAVNAVTGAFVGAAGLISGGKFVPAKPGDYVTIFGSGFGATNPPFFAGDLPDRVASVTAGVSITLGGKALETSDILYVGVTPGFAGLYQVNIRIPDDAADGDLPLSIAISGIPSPDGAYLTIKK